jgi:hypothetical protein
MAKLSHRGAAGVLGQQHQLRGPFRDGGVDLAVPLGQGAGPAGDPQKRQQPGAHPSPLGRSASRTPSGTVAPNREASRSPRAARSRQASPSHT